MLIREMTTWLRLRRMQRPDGAGGMIIGWTPDGYFQGCVTQKAGTELAPGGHAALMTRAVLMHSPETTLYQGDRVMEVGTGRVWRVCGNSDDMISRHMAGVGCAQVPVERVVTAP